LIKKEFFRNGDWLVLDISDLKITVPIGRTQEGSVRVRTIDFSILRPMLIQMIDSEMERMYIPLRRQVICRHGGNMGPAPATSKNVLAFRTPVGGISIPAGQSKQLGIVDVSPYERIRVVADERVGSGTGI